MNIISSSFGNDSVALIQWAVEAKLKNVTVVYIDTGWGGVGWNERIEIGKSFVEKCGFDFVKITPEIQFTELMKMKKGFPNNRYQWCSGLLKGVPFLNWIDEIDKQTKAVVLIGKRRVESMARKNTPEFVEKSEYHGDRKLWHPLYKHTDTQRNELLDRAGFEVLPHRSKECDPCVNANRQGFIDLHQKDIDKVVALEGEIDKTMFRPKPHGGAIGILEVVKWAKYGQGKYIPGQADLLDLGCGSPFGCGL